ncbi:hypothetical protein P7F88_25250 [Vibrio hannami]|uniref:hypothetical protein n=1 Tax=Vibrio hannami TaxID=2717094 RepID=UPI00240FD7C5|nr:hypothetical protein [Vibrio hannami]MDG3089172.1 hypothetical protein [Vibrio hannami]
MSSKSPSADVLAIIDETRRERVRSLLMLAYSDEMPIRSSDATVFERGTTGKPQNVFVTATRAKGSSKVICHGDVFKHNQLKRVVATLPDKYRLWIEFQYGEQVSDEGLNDVVELVFDDMENVPTRKDAKANYKKMFNRIFVSRRNVQELLDRDLIEAMQISRRVFIRRYKGARLEVEQGLSALDNKAIDMISEKMGSRL